MVTSEWLKNLIGVLKAIKDLVNSRGFLSAALVGIIACLLYSITPKMETIIAKLDTCIGKAKTITALNYAH